jgi:uncharacterized tellurite resistance protein B-like protein
MGLLELFNSYDKKKRKSHFKNLYSVARVDGEVARAEMDLIVDLAEKFQMSTAEVLKVIRNPDGIDPVLPKTPGERMEHLYDLVTVMLVDGEIDERELFLCKSLGLKLGCGEESLDPLLREMIEAAMQGVAPEKAVAGFLEKYS